MSAESQDAPSEEVSPFPKRSVPEFQYEEPPLAGPRLSATIQYFVPPTRGTHGFMSKFTQLAVLFATAKPWVRLPAEGDPDASARTETNRASPAGASSWTYRERRET